MPASARPPCKTLPAVLELLRAMHRESEMRAIPVDVPKLTMVIERCISRDDHCCLVYRNARAELLGVLIGHANEHFFSRQKGVWDLAFYVRPEMRGSIVAHRLWRAFRDWAVSVGANELWMGTGAGISVERADRFLTGLGMRRAGGIYRLDFRNGSESGNTD